MIYWWWVVKFEMKSRRSINDMSDALVAHHMFEVQMFLLQTIRVLGKGRTTILIETRTWPPHLSSFDSKVLELFESEVHIDAVRF